MHFFQSTPIYNDVYTKLYISLEEQIKFQQMQQYLILSSMDPTNSVLEEPSIFYVPECMSLYAPYSLLLISNKFWMGGGGRWGVGGGEARGPSEGENKRGGGEGVEGFLYRTGGVGGGGGAVR